MNCHDTPNCPACVDAARTLAKHGVPAHLRNGLRRYVVHGTGTGGLLEAVLSNDLMRAVFNADADSRPALLEIIRWLHNEAPAPCHGSPAKVKAWLQGGSR